MSNVFALYDPRAVVSLVRKHGLVTDRRAEALYQRAQLAADTGAALIKLDPDDFDYLVFLTQQGEQPS